MRLNRVDVVIIAVYLVCITLFGLRFRKSQKSLRDYFLADRNIPWWAIGLSIVAAETSTLTIIGTPAIAYSGNFSFLQLVFGYLAGRIMICILFIPQYFRGEMFTAYQLIDRRFGPVLHRVAAGVFLALRAAAEGVRVWAVSIVVLTAFHISDVAAVTVIMALTLVYTFEGGLAAVIWTDVIQMAIYVAGTLVGFYTLTHLIPGGWPAIHSIAGQAGKLRVLDFSFNLLQTYTFWAGLIGGTFITMASHGADQLLVQRLLAARSEREAKLALLSSGAAILIQFTLFLLVGAGLWTFYGQHPSQAHFSRPDYIFPTFIVDHLPHGVSGLLIAAILAAAMSNLSAALNSLSSTTMIDFYLPAFPKTTDGRRILLSRMSTVAWGIVLFLLGLASRRGGSVLERGLAIASLAYGGLLGIFLLGVLTRRAKQTGAIVGMLCGLAVNIFIWGWTPVPFTWYVTVGSLTTFLVGYAASLAQRHAN